MENLKKCCFGLLPVVSSNLLIGVLAYLFGFQSASSYYALKTNQSPNTKPAFTKWKSPSESLPSTPDVHSPLFLTELAKYEAFIETALSDLAQNQSHLLNATLAAEIEEYLYVYSSEMLMVEFFGNAKFSNNQALAIAQNPILSLNMIWRFVNDLTPIRDQIEEEIRISRVHDGLVKDFLIDLSLVIPKWPKRKTLYEAMDSLLRLQLVYDLNATELSTGRIFGVDTGTAKMSIALMYALGKFARARKIYPLAVPWLELAREKMNLLELKGEKTTGLRIGATEIQSTLMATVMEHDLERSHRSPWQYHMYIDKLLDENGNFVKERHTLRKVDWAKEDGQIWNSTYEEIKYWSLCSGDVHQTDSERSKLICWYDRTSNPALSIFPIKKELLSMSPYIVQMYDVIGDATIKQVVEPTKYRLTRSKVLNEVDGTGTGIPTVDSGRTSVSSSVAIRLLKLEKLIEWATGLDLSSWGSSEMYLIASYAFGGHYDCHVDSFENEQETRLGGDRIATIMFYLQDTESGGRTTFVRAGTSAEPIKGSAVFWYNLKRSGKTDASTQHCACPVILGHKSILNKWILFDKQFRLRSCGLHEDE